MTPGASFEVVSHIVNITSCMIACAIEKESLCVGRIYHTVINIAGVPVVNGFLVLVISNTNCNMIPII